MQEACQRLADQREAAGDLRAMTRKTVVLDLMHPLAAGWQLIGFGWQARRDEPGREGAHTQHNAAYLGTIAAHLNLIARLMLSDD